MIDYYNHVLVVVVDINSPVELKVEDEEDDDIPVGQIEQVGLVLESLIIKK